MFSSSFYSWKFVLKQYFYNMILQQLRTTSGPAECVCHSRVCILCNLENEVRNTFTNYDKNANNFKNRVKKASINQIRISYLNRLVSGKIATFMRTQLLFEGGYFNEIWFKYACPRALPCRGNRDKG